VLRAEHGDGYTDRGLPQARSEATRRFLESVDVLLPEQVRGAIREVGVLAQERGIRAYVVGGFVRDMLLGRRNLDVDVVVEGDGIAFADLAAQRLGGRVKAHMRFGTAVLVLSRALHIDVTSARTEYYTRPGALPTVERSSLRQDLLRRDFSINAMAAAIDPAEFGQVTDPFGGLRDLQRGSIRALHSLSFVEDPTRVMRAARFERRFGFVMEPATADLARHAVEMGLLDDISGARIRAELFAILAEEPATTPLERLHELGALAGLLPHGVQPSDALADAKAMEGTLLEMPWCSGRAPRRVTALLTALAARSTVHDVERWAHWLRVGRANSAAPMQIAARGASVMRALKDAHAMRDSRLHAILADLEPESIAYVRSRGSKRVRARVDRFEGVLSPIRLDVTGDDLAALGAEPSAAFSGILQQALADRLDGVAVGREAELENLRRLAAKAGLIP
jgi:tRNA nucleotidyltransferase (CCA-adding enzyme)